MPVFFFVDPAFAEDPYLTSCDKLTLSYTFFKTGDEEMEMLERKERKKEERNMMEQLVAQKGKRVMETDGKSKISSLTENEK